MNYEWQSLMSKFNNIVENLKKITLKILTFVFVRIVKVISMTWRYDVNYRKLDENELRVSKSKFIFIFWHNRMLPAWHYLSKFNSAALVSQSKDGTILTNILVQWGIEVIRGSSSKGGKEALEDLQNKVKSNHILMTPDGPRGPIYKVKPGCLIISAREKSNIILVGVEIKEKFTFHKSWDKFEFPLPFSKIIIDLEKIEIIPNDDRDFINSKLEEVELLLKKINKI